MRSQLVVAILAAVQIVTCQQLKEPQCVDYLRSLDGPSFIVMFDNPVRNSAAYWHCFHRGGFLPSLSDMSSLQVNCGSELVPLNGDNTDGCFPFKSSDDLTTDDQKEDVPAFNFTASECRFVDSSYLYKCIICQFDVIRYPFDNVPSMDDGLTTSRYFVVRLTSTDVRENTDVDVDSIRAELYTLLKPTNEDMLKFHRSLLDKSRHLQVDYHVYSWISKSVTIGNATTLVLNDSFRMTVEDVDFCPDDELVGKDGGVTLWPRKQSNKYGLAKGPKDGTILRRNCFLYYDNFLGIWDTEPTWWEFAWRLCESPHDQYVNEEHYKQFLDAAGIATRHVNVVNVFASAYTVNSTVVKVQKDPQCVQHLRSLDGPGLRVDFKKMKNSSRASDWCFYRGGVLPYWRDVPSLQVNCDSQLVRVNSNHTDGCLPFESPDDANPNDQVEVVPVFNFTTGECRFVESSYLFSCFLCQYEVMRYPFVNIDTGYDDLTKSYFFLVRLTSVDVRQTTDVDKEALKLELKTILKPLFNDSINYHRAEFDETQHLQVEFGVTSYILASAAMGNATTLVLNNSFTMYIEDVDFCPSEELVGKDGGMTLWPKSLTYIYKLTKSPKGDSILRRDCFFDYDKFLGIWNNVSRWELVWRPCESPYEQYTNEEQYKQFLDAEDIDIRHSNVLHEFASLSVVNSSTFKEVARFVETAFAANNELNFQTLRDLITVTANLEIDSDQHVILAMEQRVYLIVAEIDTNDPVVGFAFEGNVTDYKANDTIAVEKAPAPVERNETTPFALDVSPRLMAANTRVAFVVLWKQMQLEKTVVRYTQYLEVSVVFPIGQVSAWTFMSYGNYFVDITYFPKLYSRELILENITTLACIAWNNDLHDWVSHGCLMLDVDRNGSNKCRCSGKYFVLHDGIPIGKFALKRGWAAHKLASYNNPMSDFFKNKTILIVATAVECLLSLLGLGSIICTAIRFKHWRENKGHKILLHMVMALTCNLLLGFTASFVRMTTASVGCLVYGVLRHYSFLAMFLWMLVLSCLQLKRLTTVVGAKATSHLILKVSAFAWGIPLLPITILLAVNPIFYQTDRFDRGYCYPEGIVFHVTVQGPAGVILLVNLCIFIKIILHIFEIIGEKKITRHSKGKRAEQLYKLKTSFFIFFLFGFSWVFHILSEERVIASDFLYEYLFLMTATTHIFALSLFFVVFQEHTRKEWTTQLKRSLTKIRFTLKRTPTT